MIERNGVRSVLLLSGKTLFRPVISTVDLGRRRRPIHRNAMGINTMVTGDNPITAAAIAARQPSMSLATLHRVQRLRRRRVFDVNTEP
jgi:hypothetical protein